MKRATYLASCFAALGAVACAQSQPPVGTAGQDATPKYGGTSHQRVSTDAFDWDITYAGNATPNDRGIALGYNSVLGFKVGPDIKYADQVLQAELAERWEISNNGRTITFHLRKGLKYANMPPVNGRELTSRDVKWSAEYFLRSGEFKNKNLPKADLAYFFDGLENVETPDPSTVVMTLKEPTAPFLNYMASDLVPILPRETYDQDGNFKNVIVGSGPYQVDVNASQKGSRWVWKKNSDYWDTGKPYIDEIRWIVLPDNSSSHAAFRAKQLDFLGLPTELITEAAARDIKAANPDAAVYEHMAPGSVTLYVNSRRPPLDDVRVRKAISRAVDRDEFVRVQGGGGWAVSGGLDGLFSQEEIRQMVPHNIEDARRLLAEAGHSNGIELEISFNAASGTTVPELLESQLKKAGIQLAIRPLEQATMSANRRSGAYTLSFTPGGSAEGDLGEDLYSNFHPDSRRNYRGVNDPKLTSMLDAQNREMDPTKRKELIRQAVHYVNVDMAWGHAIIHPQKYYFWQPYLKIPGLNNWRTELFPAEVSWLEK